jgi:hypothetical protein
MNKDRAFHELVMLVCRARVFVWEQEETRNPVECGRQRAWLDAAHRLLKDTQSFRSIGRTTEAMGAGTPGGEWMETKLDSKSS